LHFLLRQGEVNEYSLGTVKDQHQAEVAVLQHYQSVVLDLCHSGHFHHVFLETLTTWGQDLLLDWLLNSYGYRNVTAYSKHSKPEIEFTNLSYFQH
jgi:hypothetical protein